MELRKSLGEARCDWKAGLLKSWQARWLVAFGQDWAGKGAAGPLGVGLHAVQKQSRTDIKQHGKRFGWQPVTGSTYSES